eukprot:scaffold232472_cov14-Tisochrysis_lutea.AAC.1
MGVDGGDNLRGQGDTDDLDDVSGWPVSYRHALYSTYFLQNKGNVWLMCTWSWPTKTTCHKFVHAVYLCMQSQALANTGAPRKARRQAGMSAQRSAMENKQPKNAWLAFSFRAAYAAALPLES